MELYYISELLTNELQKVKNGEGLTNIGQQLQFGRLTKLEFPRFSGDDVKGWIYRCNQFFKLDNIQDEHKVHLASVHLPDKALAWHWQFVKMRGENVPWEEYEHEILTRFGPMYEDPLADLKNLKQDGSVRQYQDEFDMLLSKVDLTEQQAISFYVGGLQEEIAMGLRMFKPSKLTDVYSLAKLQEATNNAQRRSLNQYFLCHNQGFQATINNRLLLLTTTDLHSFQ